MALAVLLLAACGAPTTDARGTDRGDAGGHSSAGDAHGAPPSANTNSHPTGSTTSEIRRLIAHAARRHGVEPALVHAVAAAESAYNARAVSPAGAVGVMQLMPATAADYGVGSRAALFDPSTNIDAGVRHLKRLLRKYRGDYGRVIMAYNAGEGVVDRTGSNVRYPETLDYTEAVLRRYRALGGTRPTDGVLRKVAALRRPARSGRPAGEAKQSRRPERFGLLPTESARLRARRPNAPLDAVSPLKRTDVADAIARGQRDPAQDRALRPGVDPAVGARGRASPDPPGLPVLR